MSRVAMVTGGTRGIGHAIVERLKNDGFKVAAGYAGNEEAAQACCRDLGVMIVKGNVGEFDDCARAVKEVEAELGPIDVLVNNAGITRDAMLHKMTPQQWNEVIFVNLASIFNMSRQVIDGMRAQGGRHRLHQGAGAGDGQQGHHCQRRGSRLHRHRDGHGRSRERDGAHRCGHSGRPAGQG